MALPFTTRESGSSWVDAVWTRALRRFVGRTAGELRSGTGGAIALDLSQRVTV